MDYREKPVLSSPAKTMKQTLSHINLKTAKSNNNCSLQFLFIYVPVIRGNIQHKAIRPAFLRIILPLDISNPEIIFFQTLLLSLDDQNKIPVPDNNHIFAKV